MARESAGSSADKDDEQWRQNLPSGVDQYERLIDKNWNDFKDVDFSNPTPQAVNGFIVHRIVFYINSKYYDRTLWEYFREDFEGWTNDIWKYGNKDVIRDLRDLLRRYGVNVKKNGGRIYERIQEIIDDAKEPAWSPEDIQYQLTEPQTFKYTPERIGNFFSKHNPNQEQDQVLPALTIPVLRTTPTPSQTPSPTIPTFTPYTNNPNLLPPTKEITNVIKIYSEEQKYGGELYDILDAKLHIFYDLCGKAGI